MAPDHQQPELEIKGTETQESPNHQPLSRSLVTRREVLRGLIISAILGIGGGTCRENPDSKIEEEKEKLADMQALEAKIDTIAKLSKPALDKLATQGINPGTFEEKHKSELVRMFKNALAMPKKPGMGTIGLDMNTWFVLPGDIQRLFLENGLMSHLSQVTLEPSGTISLTYSLKNGTKLVIKLTEKKDGFTLHINLDIAGQNEKITWESTDTSKKHEEFFLVDNILDNTRYATSKRRDKITNTESFCEATGVPGSGSSNAYELKTIPQRGISGRTSGQILEGKIYGTFPIEFLRMQVENNRWYQFIPDNPEKDTTVDLKLKALAQKLLDHTKDKRFPQEFSGAVDGN